MRSGMRAVTDRAMLPHDVRDYLGQKLRAAYREKQEKPAYLGDPALPRRFDDALQQLTILCSRRERASRCGFAAVAAALAEPGFR
jgi:hypothetical protein